MEDSFFFSTNYQSIVISIGLHKAEPSSWIELTVYIFSDSFIFLCYDFSEIYFFLLSKTDYMQIEILKSIYKLHLPCIEGIAKIWYHLFPLLKGTGIYMIMIFYSLDGRNQIHPRKRNHFLHYFWWYNRVVHTLKRRRAYHKKYRHIN